MDKSIIDLLKQDAEEIAAIKDVYIPITGWENTNLSIRYRLPESGAELDRIARKVIQEVKKENRFERGLKTAMDTLITLSEGLYVQPVGVDKPVELDPNETGAAVNIIDGEEILAPIFGWKPGEADNARKALKKLFGNNDLAIINHAEKLNRWLVDTRADIKTELWQLGEAE